MTTMSTMLTTALVVLVLALSVSAQQQLRGSANLLEQSPVEIDSAHRNLQTCLDDEPSSEENPIVAMLEYQTNNAKFPLGAVGKCGDPEDGYTVEGMPASPARPVLFQRCMFGTITPNSNECHRNFNHHDLPISSTYYDTKGRPVDVYTPQTTAMVALDLFKNDDGSVDPCKPGDYTSTKGFFLYGSPKGGIDHYFPAPTIKNCRGRQGVVRFENDATRASISVHLHGAASAAPYDGWADDVTEVGHVKNYFYPNNRPTTLWYHDHSVHITSNNAYAGLAGEYIIKDCDSELENVYLPDEEHSIPFVLKDAVLQSMGDYRYDLLYDKMRDHKNNLYGDIILLNGVPWPKHPVDRRTYRLRILDVSITRPFYLKFLAVSNLGEQAWLPFWLVQTDGGNVKEMVKLYSLFNAVAERHAILVNFNPNSKAYTDLAGGDFWKHVYVVNDFGQDSKAPPSFCKTHLLARFDISETPEDVNQFRGVDHELAGDGDAPNVLQAVHTSVLGQTVPSMAHPFKALRNLIPENVIANQIARAQAGEYDRVFDFGRSGGQWTVNGCSWEDENCRIIANPSRNGYELWKLKGHGGWYHPVHIHLIDFLVLLRTGGTSDLWQDYDSLDANSGKFNTLNGLKGLRPWEEDGAKDVVHLGHGEDLWVFTQWGPHDGDFMFHCHNLVHEDSDMMVAAGLGRNDRNQLTLTQIFKADGGRQDVPLSTKDQTDEFYKFSTTQTTVDAWDNTSPETSFEENGGSPYSPQIAGEISSAMRSGMGDPAHPKGDNSEYANFTPHYLCGEVCKGLYASFYPDMNDDTSAKQMDFRAGFEETTDNPIHLNIWAVPFKPFQSATNVTFTTKLDTYTDQSCGCTATA